MRAIAARMFWTEGTVRHALKEMGVPIRPRHIGSAKARKANPTGAEVHAEEIVHMYTVELATVPDICREFGFSQTPIRNVLRRRGIKFEYRAPKRMNWPEYERTKELYLSGLSCLEVGKIQGLHRTTVQERLDYLEVPRRPRKSRVCKRGHEMNKANTYHAKATPGSRAKRQCRKCHALRQRQYTSNSE